MRRHLGASLFVLASFACGCGGAGSRFTHDLRTQLTADANSSARERAPDLVALAEGALDDADASASAGDEAAAADHVTRARLLLEAALAEAARIGDEEERRAIETTTAEMLALARRDEAAREAISAELTRLASIRTAREEAQRALTEAESDEARPGRRGRVSMQDTPDLRRATAALRARAELLSAAARALGADDAALAPMQDALRASERERADPLAALAAVDRAHREALRALGRARATAEGPGPDGVTALAEAATAEGFEALALPEGLAVEAHGLFSGNAVAVSHAARGRVERLAALIAAHPHGPVQVEVQVPQLGARGEQLAGQRAEALSRLLVSAGVPAERLTAHGIPAALQADEAHDEGRLVFVAYAIRTE